MDAESLSTLSTYIEDDISLLLTQRITEVQQTTIEIEKAVSGVKRDLKKSSSETIKDIKRLSKRMKVLEDSFAKLVEDVTVIKDTISKTTVANLLETINAKEQATETNQVQR